MTRIYELQNHILIHTSDLNPAEHCHMAAHIMISLKGLMKVSADVEEYCCHGIMIPSGVAHKVETFDNPVLVFLYASSTNVTKRIQKVTVIQESKITEIISSYTEFEKESNKANYNKIEKLIFNLLEINDNFENLTDERIVSAMEYVKSRSAEKVSCKEAADMVYLSEGRFSHLFKEQVGMTFASYVICQRIFKVYSEVMQGKSVTEAAIEAGFSSSAHFADVNRRVFGISIRNTMKNLSYTKII